MTELLPELAGPSDAELITRVRAGDSEAYGDLFARHSPAAERLARQITRGRDADDLVSEAFAKLLVTLQAGGGPDVAFRAYLLTAVRRLHVDRIRSAARVTTTDDLEVYDPGVPFQDTAVEGFESGAAARAFESLPERWRMVLWHLDVEGQKPADVAPLLGMTPNSVSALAYRAREGLRQAFLTAHLADTADTTCRWTVEHLGGYVRDGLSARDQGKVKQHLDECASCTAMYLELVEVNSGLAGLIGPLVLGSAAAGYLGTGAAGSGGLIGGVVVLFDRGKDFVANNLLPVGAAAAAAVAAAAIAAFALGAGGGTPVKADPPAATAPARPGASTAPTPGGGPTPDTPTPSTGPTVPVVTPPLVTPSPTAGPTSVASSPAASPTPTHRPSPSPTQSDVLDADVTVSSAEVADGQLVVHLTGLPGERVQVVVGLDSTSGQTAFTPSSGICVVTAERPDRAVCTLPATDAAGRVATLRLPLTFPVDLLTDDLSISVHIPGQPDLHPSDNALDLTFLPKPLADLRITTAHADAGSLVVDLAGLPPAAVEALVSLTSDSGRTHFVVGHALCVVDAAVVDRAVCAVPSGSADRIFRAVVPLDFPGDQFTDGLTVTAALDGYNDPHTDDNSESFTYTPIPLADLHLSLALDHSGNDVGRFLVTVAGLPSDVTDDDVLTITLDFDRAGITLQEIPSSCSADGLTLTCHTTGLHDGTWSGVVDADLHTVPAHESTVVTVGSALVGTVDPHPGDDEASITLLRPRSH